MRIIIWGVVLLLISASAWCGETGYQWELIKKKDGIDVYSSRTPGSDFRTYKAQSIIERPWEVLFEVLLDVPGYSGWMPGCRSSSIVKMVHDDPIKGNFIIHFVWDAIWPVKNRDLVVAVNSDHDWDNDHVSVVLQATDQHNIPVPEGLVRLNAFFARFDFKYIDRNRTEVVFVTMIDPGGIVPSGVADIQTATVPFDTLKGLAKQAGNPKYYKQAVMDYF